MKYAYWYIKNSSSNDFLTSETVIDNPNRATVTSYVIYVQYTVKGNSLPYLKGHSHKNDI
jgi:ABC-type oligopeptide transport system substrate-binding subunit